MGVLLLSVLTSETGDTLNRNFQRSTSAKYPDVDSISQFVESVCSGNQAGDGTNPPSVTVDVQDNMVQATGHVVLTNAVATNTVVINGKTFTAVSSGANASQFNVGVNDNATAINLVSAINALTGNLVAEYVTASKTTTANSPAIVQITSNFYGIAGNQATLAATGAIYASAARLTGGADDPNEKVYTF
jgi:hypothetical protein